MPALYTHYRLGLDVLNKLNEKEQKQIKSNIEYYNMYNQGFDNLYYHFKWNYYRDFGVNAHKHDIDLFFQNIFTYIKENNLENESEITNIIYGFINHITLDTIIHPYINYQVNNLNIPHTKIEFMLDYHNYIKDSNTKWHNKIYKTLIPKLKFNNNLLDFLNYIFLHTYKEDNIGKVFNRSHNNSYYIYRYFITDLSGIKAFFYKIIDKIIRLEKFKLHQNTFNKKVDVRILNSDKDIWHHANNKEETYNYSLEELYNYCVIISTKLNKLAYKVLNNDYDLNELISLINKVSLKNIQEFLD